MLKHHSELMFSVYCTIRLGSYNMLNQVLQWIGNLSHLKFFIFWSSLFLIPMKTRKDIEPLNVPQVTSHHPLLLLPSVLCSLFLLSPPSPLSCCKAFHRAASSQLLSTPDTAFIFVSLWWKRGGWGKTQRKQKKMRVSSDKRQNMKEPAYVLSVCVI